jgi:tRNA A37 threonylcarbamoyladenosine synthetase subunit TsaC/SUA5/YrdC
MKTPYEQLKSLPEARQYLKVGITVEQLDAQAVRMSDHEAALALNHARSTLFQTIAAANRKQA